MVREYYFDKYNRTMAYVFGAFYAMYRDIDKDSFMLEARDKDLLELVNRELHSDSEICEEDMIYGTHIRGAGRIVELCESRGLIGNRFEKMFPRDIPGNCLGHFVRGFFDAEANVGMRTGSRYVRVNFSKEFLVVLHNVLKVYADVEGGKPVESFYEIDGEDVNRIGEFMYYDWDYIKQRGLFVPGKRRFFVPGLDDEIEVDDELREKMEIAKEYLVQGFNNIQVAKKLWYGNEVTFRSNFKLVTGMSPFGYLREVKTDLMSDAKELLKEGMPISEVATLTGYAMVESFVNAYKRFLGESPREVRTEGFQSRKVKEFEAVLMSVQPGTPVSEFAHRLGYTNANNFGAMFKRLFGITYREWWVRTKAEAGRGMLIEGVSAKEAAAKLGYSEVQTFYKSFKKKFGVTVGEFLKQAKSGKSR